MKKEAIIGFPYTIYDDGTLINDKGVKIRANEINTGYLMYHLKNKGKRWAVLAHRLVAIYFIDNSENKEHVHHIDNNKKNNCASNLRWVTKEENAKLAWADGMCEKVRLSAKKRMSEIGKRYAHINKLNLIQKSNPVKLTNIETKEVLFYDSLRECGKNTGLDRRGLAQAIKVKRLYKNNGQRSI